MSTEVPEGKRILLVPLGHVITMILAQEILEAFDTTAASNLAYAYESNSVERQYAYLQEVEKSGDPFWLIRHDGRLIGTIALREYDRRNRNARFGVLIFRKEDQSLHYGSEAVSIIESYASRKLELHKIYVRILTRNDHGFAWWIRHGYSPEGVMREEYLLQNGTYADMLSLVKFAPSS